MTARKKCIIMHSISGTVIPYNNRYRELPARIAKKAFFVFILSK
jgi:hypothetical protein